MFVAVFGDRRRSAEDLRQMRAGSRCRWPRSCTPGSPAGRDRREGQGTVRLHQIGTRCAADGLERLVGDGRRGGLPGAEHRQRLLLNSRGTGQRKHEARPTPSTVSSVTGAVDATGRCRRGASATMRPSWWSAPGGGERHQRRGQRAAARSAARGAGALRPHRRPRRQPDQGGGAGDPRPHRRLHGPRSWPSTIRWPRRASGRPARPQGAAPRLPRAGAERPERCVYCC